MKLYYEPRMFDYMLESVDRDRMVIATYYVEDVRNEDEFIDHLRQVERLALEGSTSSWMDVAEETDELRERLTSKVLGYYEIPAPKGTKKAIVQLGFPDGAWDINLNVPMLLLSIAGNFFAFPTKTRLLDVTIPSAVAKRFKGPKYGIEGIRKILGVEKRPLCLQIIKPKMGMTPQQTADQVYQSALGGADLCKDDEMLGELDVCPLEARLEAVLKALEKAEKETGHKTLYMVSITDEVDKINEKARMAVRMGATGLLLAYSAGLSSLRVLAEDEAAKAPILLHVSHMLGLLPTINFPTLAKLCRLCGADMMLTPSIWSSIPVASLEESLRVSQTLHAPFYHIKRAWPMPAAGMYPGLMAELVKENGPDIIVPAGGGMLGHPMGYKAG
ncbi:MAG TPA: RuBisCO large subunit C-terminal-like domain-containing protein, partial [Anaerolineales bacterium]|nr:RuBisCO large subunit C-terminal-like domain-containing protein [Anaerolineales bacterium]